MNATTLTPLADRVLIKPDDPPTQTESGLHLVEHWRAEQTGVVTAIGAWAQTRPQDFAVGDTVVFAPTAGEALLLNRGEPDEARYLVMRVADVLAVIEG